MFLDPPADRESDSALAEPLSGSTVADVLDLQTTLISDIAQVRRPQLMSVTVTASSLDCHCYRSGNPPAVDVRNLRPSEQELHTHTHTHTYRAGLFVATIETVCCGQEAAQDAALEPPYAFPRLANNYLCTAGTGFCGRPASAAI